MRTGRNDAHLGPAGWHHTKFCGHQALLEATLQALRFDAPLGCPVLSLRHSRVGISGAYRAGCGDEDGHRNLYFISFNRLRLFITFRTRCYFDSHSTLSQPGWFPKSQAFWNIVFALLARPSLYFNEPRLKQDASSPACGQPSSIDRSRI